MSAQLQAEHQKTLLQEQQEEQYLGVAKMALGFVLLVMAGAIFAFFVCTDFSKVFLEYVNKMLLRRQEESKIDETEKLVGEKKSEENV